MAGRHLEQAVQSLSLSGEQQISLGICYQGGDLLQIVVGFVGLS